FASEQNDAGSGQDASNEGEGAYLLTPGTFTGFLDRVDRYDWYKIDLEQGQILSIDFTAPETAMFSLHLYRGTSSTYHASLQRVVGQTNTIQYAAGHRETCYIEVARISGGEYELNINVKNQNDASSGQDASNEREGAYPLTPGTFTGFLEYADDEDWYKIDLERGAIVSVNLAVPETANFDLYLDPSGQRTIVRSTYGAGQDEAVRQYAVEEAGTCYIRVVLRDGEGEYQLTLEVKNQNDAGSGQDVSNEREGAYPLTPGTYTGFLKHADDYDWYEINVMKGQILSINLTVPQTADFDLFPLHPPYMPEHHGTGQDEGIQYVPQQIGPQYFRIVRNSGEGEYQLTIEIQDQNDAGSGQDAS
ncbi:MAG: PPC domain-containing protein, partial [Dehalococcoidia bacterium]|nr:PPC domain-containing protein [Dehalococcoidia bacterium]